MANVALDSARPGVPVTLETRLEGLRVVAFGGGTGLPVLLRGLREAVDDGAMAVVTVADDGGSSGRLRRELGVAPRGDVRNCLVALATRRGLAEVFSYRFAEGGDLRDHSVGNLIIAALADMAGGFTEGVEQAGRFLRIRGRVLPAATESLTLVLRETEGRVTRGESTLRVTGRALARVGIEPAGASAPLAVLEAIEAADVVVLGPGSLFTSTIPALLGAGVREALARSRAPVIHVSNVMTQPGETTGFTVADHLRGLAEHVGPVVTDVLVHAGTFSRDSVAAYRREGAAPVGTDREAIERLGVRLWERELLAHAAGTEVRHDPDRLAQAVLEVAAARVGLDALTGAPPGARRDSGRQAM